MRTRLRNILILSFAAVIAVVVKPASAQIAPYAMFSAGHYSGQGVGPGATSNSNGGVTAYGTTIGVSDDLLRLGPMRVGGDVRGLIENSANSTPYGNKIAAGFAGLRLDGSGIPAFPFVPYIQAEIGVAGTNSGNSFSKDSSMAYQVQFGGDFSLFPHIAARLEYGAGQLIDSGESNHTLQTFGAGIVVRL